MATLTDVVDELRDNGDGIDRINNTMKSVLTALNLQRLDMLESMREAKQPKSSGGTRGGGGSGGAGFPGLMAFGGLGALASTLGAIAASVTGLDEVFKAARLFEIAESLAKTFGKFRDATVGAGRGLISVMQTFIDRVGKFGTKLADIGRALSKIVVFPEETKALLQSTIDNLKGKVLGIVDDVRLRWMLFADDAKKLFGEKLDTFKTSVTGLVDQVKSRFTLFKLDVGTALTDKFKPVITTFEGLVDTVSARIKPITDFFSDIGTKFAKVVSFFPSINFSAIGDIFGALGTADSPGKGILGFFGSIADFARPILTPLKTVLNIALRPFFQFMLSAIDFVMGFYEGFTDEDGTIVEKMKAGIEGGIKGVIKGFTDAIDLIFIELPAWVAGKLGFEGVAATLKDFSLTALVDPAWEAVKNFFMDTFRNPSAQFAKVAGYLKDLPETFLKNILSAILPHPDTFKFTAPSVSIMGKEFGGGTFNLNPVPDGLYEYAGINPVTGAIKPDLSSIMRDAAAASSAAELDASAGAGAGGTGGNPVVLVGGDDNSQTSNQTNMFGEQVANPVID